DDGERSPRRERRQAHARRRTMQRRPNVVGPSDLELRARAASRVARRRAFTVSATVLGSLIPLNLYFYSQDHRSTWLLLDVVFAGILCVRAWYAFGSERHIEQRIQSEVLRMRASNPQPTSPPTQAPSRSVVAPQYTPQTPPRPDRNGSTPSETFRQ